MYLVFFKKILIALGHTGMGVYVFKWPSLQPQKIQYEEKKLKSPENYKGGFENYEFISQTGMRCWAGTNLQPPNAQCITSIITMVIQNNLKLPSSIKSNVDAKCRFHKCMDEKNMFSLGWLCNFFWLFLWRSFRFSLLVPSIKKNDLHVANIYYNMEFMFFYLLPWRQVGIQFWWREHGRGEKWIVVAMLELKGKGREGGTALWLLVLYVISSLVRGGSQMMSAKNGGVQTPLPPLSAIVSIYPTPPPTFFSHCQHFHNPPPSFASPVSICFTLPPFNSSFLSVYLRTLSFEK